MIGHEIMTALVTKTVRDRLPMVMQARALRKAPELLVSVPDVEFIYPHPVPTQSIEGYPCLMVEELETGPRYTTRQLSSNGDLETLEIRYVFRVWSYVRGSDYKHTGYQQKYLATSLRMALMESRCLLETDNESAVIDPNTFRESFSNVAGDEDAQKYLAGHYAEFEIIAAETNRPSQLPDDLMAMFSVSVGLLQSDSAEAVPPTITPVVGTP